MAGRSINLRHIAPAERNRLIGRALEMRASGMQIQEIADQLGVHRGTIIYWTNPESRAKTKERSLAKNRPRERQRNGSSSSNVGHVVQKGTPQADYLARLQEVPPDTRSLTARLCGDPLPSRSALALKP